MCLLAYSSKGVVIDFALLGVVRTSVNLVIIFVHMVDSSLNTCRYLIYNHFLSERDERQRGPIICAKHL